MNKKNDHTDFSSYHTIFCRFFSAEKYNQNRERTFKIRISNLKWNYKNREFCLENFCGTIYGFSNQTLLYFCERIR